MLVNKRPRSRFVILAVFGLLFGGFAVGEEQVSVLTILQKTSGLEPQEDDTSPPTFQRVTVDTAGKRLVLDEFRSQPRRQANPSSVPEPVARRLILRMDKEPPTIWEVSPPKKEYREYEGNLNHLQRDRRITEINEIKLAKRTFSRREQEKFFQENYLRPDGKRVVELKRGKGETILGHECEHIVVVENGRTIIDAQISTDVPGARSYFQLYRRLGVFSEDVLNKISSIEGIPLKGKITVVSALPVHELEVEVLDIAHRKIPASEFKPPSGFRKYEEVPPELICAYCQKKLFRDRIGGKLQREDGSFLYTCSEECSEKFLDEGLLDAPVPESQGNGPR